MFCPSDFQKMGRQNPNERSQALLCLRCRRRASSDLDTGSIPFGPGRVDQDQYASTQTTIRAHFARPSPPLMFDALGVRHDIIPEPLLGRHLD